MTRPDERPIDRDLRTYLTRVAALFSPSTPARFRSYEQLVLTLGQPHRAGPLPRFIRPGPMTFCYQNTLDLVRMANRTRTRGGPITYCEGYALPVIDGQPLVPVLHAWALTADGDVWDATWPDPEQSSYYGIAFAWPDVARFDALGDDYLGILPSDYRLRCPLLRTGQLFPPADERSVPDVLPRRDPGPDQAGPVP